MLDIRRTLYVFTLIDENRLRRMGVALLTGDRALVDVVVHEVSHSWFGNGVTSVSDSLSNTYHLIQPSHTSATPMRVISGSTKAGQLTWNVFFSRSSAHQHIATFRT